MDERYMEVAEAMEEAQRARAVEAVIKSGVMRSSNDLLEPDQYKATECDDCGNDLETFRMQRGMTTCVYCQTRREKPR